MDQPLVKNTFWFDCPVCKGTGIVANFHPKASKRFHSGQVVVDKRHKYCGPCGGSGLIVNRNVGR